MIDDPQFQFRYGQCHAMALALHGRTGLPLGIIAGEYGDPAAPELECCRPVVMVGEGAYLDVDGYHLVAETGMIGFANAVHAIRLVPARTSEIDRFFGDRVDPAMVAMARDYIEQDAALKAQLARFRPVDVTA
jgi:hypothetical protein